MYELKTGRTAEDIREERYVPAAYDAAGMQTAHLSARMGASFPWLVDTELRFGVEGPH